MENFGQSNYSLSKLQKPGQGDSNVRGVPGRAAGPGALSRAPAQPGFASKKQSADSPAWRGGEKQGCSERLEFLREGEG